MKLVLEPGASAHSIGAYGPGYIVINQKRTSHSVVVTPEVILPWQPEFFDDLLAEHFSHEEILSTGILIIGTGLRQQFPDTPLIKGLIERNIGIEIMDTAAACRTYNILLAEGRNVTAALLMIEAQ